MKPEPRRFAKLAAFARPRSRTSRSSARLPSGPAPLMPAKIPRGRTTGSSSLPVAMPSRNSRRLAIIHFTPRCCASGRITCSSPWLTRTISSPASMRDLSSSMPSIFRYGCNLYLKYSSPSRSSRSRLMPRSTVWTTRVAKTRLRGIKKRPQHRHDQDQPAAHPALQKGLRVPGEEGNGPDRGQVREAAFHSPVHPGGGARIVVGLFQIVFVLILSGLPAAEAETYCKQSSQKDEEGKPPCISRLVTVKG